MSGLLDKLMDSAKKAEIGYGIHSPCVILSVTNKERKNKDGVALKRNNYTTFGKLGKEGKVVAQKEISWFNIDPTSDYAYNNFFNQLDQMVGILDCYYTDEKKDIVAAKIDAIFEEEEIESINDLEEAIKDKKVCKSIMDSLSEVYTELMEDKVGEDSQTLRLKLSFDSKGKYIQQPKFDPFTESTEVPTEDSRLKMSKTEEEYKLKSQNLSSVTGAAPTANI